jgi:cysteinyl-tRNA synthetase
MRFFLLSGHYRSPINFNREVMEQSKNGLTRMINAKHNLVYLIAHAEGGLSQEEAAQILDMAKFRDKFIAAMEDDLNTADAISAIFELIKDINTYSLPKSSREFGVQALALLNELTDVLGLLKDKEESGIDPEIEALIAERQQARKDKNFARSDEIRDLLKARGIALEDTPSGIRIVKL